MSSDRDSVTTTAAEAMSAARIAVQASGVFESNEGCGHRRSWLLRQACRAVGDQRVRIFDNCSHLKLKLTMILLSRPRATFDILKQDLTSLLASMTNLQFNALQNFRAVSRLSCHSHLPHLKFFHSAASVSCSQAL